MNGNQPHPIISISTNICINSVLTWLVDFTNPLAQTEGFQFRSDLDRSSFLHPLPSPNILTFLIQLDNCVVIISSFKNAFHLQQNSTALIVFRLFSVQKKTLDLDELTSGENCPIRMTGATIKITQGMIIASPRSKRALAEIKGYPPPPRKFSQRIYTIHRIGQNGARGSEIRASTEKSHVWICNQLGGAMTVA